MPVKVPAKSNRQSQLPTETIASIELVSADRRQLVNYVLTRAMRGRRLKIRPICIGVADKIALLECMRKSDTRGLFLGADAVLPIGQATIFASRMLCKQPLKTPIEAGDLFDRLIPEMQKRRVSCYFLGGSPEQSTRAIGNARRKHPTLRIAGYRHGCFASLVDELEALKSINEAKPDIVWLDLPPIEAQIFMMRNAERLHNVSVMIAAPQLIETFAMSLDPVQKRSIRWRLSEALASALSPVRRLVSHVRALPVALTFIVYATIKRQRPV